MNDSPGVIEIESPPTHVVIGFDGLNARFFTGTVVVVVPPEAPGTVGTVVGLGEREVHLVVVAATERVLELLAQAVGVEEVAQVVERIGEELGDVALRADVLAERGLADPRCVEERTDEQAHEPDDDDVAGRHELARRVARVGTGREARREVGRGGHVRT